MYSTVQECSWGGDGSGADRHGDVAEDAGEEDAEADADRDEDAGEALLAAAEMARLLAGRVARGLAAQTHHVVDGGQRARHVPGQPERAAQRDQHGEHEQVQMVPGALLHARTHTWHVRMLLTSQTEHKESSPGYTVCAICEVL